jgi:hypothetical protein
MLIRHAEKPDGKRLGPGLTVLGIADKKSLVIRGWQRAGAWAALLGATAASEDFPQPDFIYAAKPDDDEHVAEVGKRPYETIIPLAQKLRIDPVIDFAKGQEGDLADRLGRLSGVVLVSWEHKAIVQSLLPALLGAQETPEVPSRWDDARFDVVLRLDREAPGAPWTFRQLCPCLLSGDSDVPL